jgi:hypothetical protein
MLRFRRSEWRAVLKADRDSMVQEAVETLAKMEQGSAGHPLYSHCWATRAT